jgi:2-polyprenyl-3-methyl-5-hydroxy-6-metoxy-1,4-benzoquinol methylase
VVTIGEVSDPGLLGRMRSVFSLDEETVSRDLHPDFNRYFRPVLRSPGAFDQYVADVRYLKAIGRLTGRVLDLAAGFGVTALCLRALGVASVSCLDLVETKTSTARKLVALAQATDVDIRHGDATTIPFDNDTFDAVLIKDAASHSATLRMSIQKCSEFCALAVI